MAVIVSVLVVPARNLPRSGVQKPAFEGRATGAVHWSCSTPPVTCHVVHVQVDVVF